MTMRRPRQITHGARRLWWRPWEQICRCGLAAWPCPVVVMLERQAQPRPRVGRPPEWNRPTTALPRSTPLMTPGQRHRSAR
jgi:hypothetical protein